MWHSAPACQLELDLWALCTTENAVAYLGLLHFFQEASVCGQERGGHFTVSERLSFWSVLVPFYPNSRSQTTEASHLDDEGRLHKRDADMQHWMSQDLFGIYKSLLAHDLCYRYPFTCRYELWQLGRNIMSSTEALKKCRCSSCF